jgi:hypothetical protein
LFFRFLVHGSPPSTWIFGLGLLPSPGKDEPAIERSSPAFTATAGSDSKGVSHMLDSIAKANILVANEPWQAHAVLLLGFAFGLFLRHGVYLLIT